MRLNRLFSGRKPEVIKSLNISRQFNRIRKDIMLVVNSGYFDERYYLENNPDLTDEAVPIPLPTLLFTVGSKGDRRHSTLMPSCTTTRS